MPPKRGGATLTGGAAKNKKSSAFGPVIRLVKNPSSLIGKCVSNVRIMVAEHNGPQQEQALQNHGDGGYGEWRHEQDYFQARTLHR